MLTPREQGDFGELSAMHWLAWRGAHIALPLGTNRHWNLIAELAGALLRVQVKKPGTSITAVGM
jgi:PD-(D/E)XK endonuclease